MQKCVLAQSQYLGGSGARCLNIHAFGFGLFWEGGALVRLLYERSICARSHAFVSRDSHEPPLLRAANKRGWSHSGKQPSRECQIRRKCG
jgi:hypothetical protein